LTKEVISIKISANHVVYIVIRLVIRCLTTLTLVLTWKL